MKVHLCILATVIFFSLQAQYPLTRSNGLTFINPSFAGTNGGFRSQSGVGHDQYLSGYSTTWTHSSADVFVPSVNAGVFVNSAYNLTRINNVQNSEIRFSRLNVNIGYAQHIPLFDKKLQVIPAITYGISGRKVRDPDRWIQSSLLETQPPETFATGSMLVRYKHIYGGFTIRRKFGAVNPHITPWNLSANLSYNWIITEKHMLSFMLHGSEYYYDDTYAEISATINRHIIAGVGYADESFLINAGYRSDRFTVFITSYDFHNLHRDTFGAWELGLSLNFRKERGRLVDHELY